MTLSTLPWYVWASVALGAFGLGLLVAEIIGKRFAREIAAGGAPLHRRAADRGVVYLVWFEVTYMVRDSHNGRFSLTKILCVNFAAMIWHIVEETKDHELSALLFALCVVTMAAAFGKSTFTFLTNRDAVKQAATTGAGGITEAVVDAVKAHIPHG